jgi:SAM-dependent methyltransferase
MWILLLIFFAFLLYFIWKYWALIIGAGYDPTPMKIARKMLEMAEVSENDVVYDLGCGDGRIVLTAAREFGARAVGIEADPIRFLIAYLRTLLSNQRDKVTIKLGNFMKMPIGDATCITLFLFTRGNDMLVPKLEKELTPGTRIVSYIWKIKGWKPDKMGALEEIYMYIVQKSELRSKLIPKETSTTDEHRYSQII